MTSFDYALLFILGCSVIVGTTRGFVREVISLIGWVVAFVVANMYGKTLAPMLPLVIPGETLRLIVAFIALFIVARIAMLLLAKAIDALISAGGLSGLNRSLGCFFGLIRGLLISLVLVLLCGLTSIPQQPFWKRAMFSPYAEHFAIMVLPLLPESIARNIKYD